MSRTIKRSFRQTIFAMLVGLMACPAAARIQPYPTAFKTETIPTNGTSLYVRVGGKGARGGPASRLR